jgi:hypothetical protein
MLCFNSGLQGLAIFYFIFKVEAFPGLQSCVQIGVVLSEACVSCDM